jgi:hypothetical protein
MTSSNKEKSKSSAGMQEILQACRKLHYQDGTPPASSSEPASEVTHKSGPRVPWRQWHHDNYKKLVFLFIFLPIGYKPTTLHLEIAELRTLNQLYISSNKMSKKMNCQDSARVDE